MRAERKRIHILRAEHISTPKWKDGIPIDPNIPKKLSSVIFYDEKGNEYLWIIDEDCRDLPKIVHNYVDADDENVSNLINPRIKKDLTEIYGIVKKYAFKWGIK